MRGFIPTDIEHYLLLFQTKLRKHVFPSPKCRRPDNCGANHLLLLPCNLPPLLCLPSSCAILPMNYDMAIHVEISGFITVIHVRESQIVKSFHHCICIRTYDDSQDLNLNAQYIS